jgi:uncharacterized DUF497 family protein
VVDQTLAVIQSKIRSLQYMMTIHAEEEMDNDGLSIYDVEEAIINGTITERQQDRYTGEGKYIIEGTIHTGDIVAVVSKLSTTGMVVIITVYIL